MSKTNDILKEAITLSPSDRAFLIDKLKSISIDKILEKYR